MGWSEECRRDIKGFVARELRFCDSSGFARNFGTAMVMFKDQASTMVAFVVKHSLPIKYFDTWNPRPIIPQQWKRGFCVACKVLRI